MPTTAFSLEWHGEELKSKVSKVCESAVRMSSGRIEATAKRLVPKQTRGLQGSIKARTWKNKKACGGIVEAGEKGREHIARFVELGTPGDVYTARSKKGRKRTPIKPKPYLRPALRREKRRFLKRFDGALK